MMEHEQINDKTFALSMQGTKLTGRLLAKAMESALKKLKEPDIKRGKQSLRSLTKQGASLADIEISGDNIGTFKKTARKYNIDFALKRDNSVNPPKWIVFFKAKDDKALDSAFKEYSNIILKQKAPKKSMLAKLKKFKDIAMSAPQKVVEKFKKMVR